MDDNNTGVYHVVIRDIRFNEDEMTPLLIGLSKLRENVFCAVYAYAMIPGFVHLLIKERDKAVVGCVEYLFECCYGKDDAEYVSERVESAERFVEIFSYIAQLPVINGICGHPGEYAYGSWVNDYENLCSINVCQTKLVLRRFGFDYLYQAVNNTSLIEKIHSFADNAFLS